MDADALLLQAFGPDTVVKRVADADFSEAQRAFLAKRRRPLCEKWSGFVDVVVASDVDKRIFFYHLDYPVVALATADELRALSEQLAPEYLVNDKGQREHRGAPVVVEGAGAFKFFDNRDGRFPHLPNDLLFVFGERAKDPEDVKKDPIRYGANAFVEPSGGWQARGESFVATALAEGAEEEGVQVIVALDGRPLLNMSTWQPHTEKRICTIGIQLTDREFQTLMNVAAPLVADWPADVEVYHNGTGRPFRVETPKKKLEKDGTWTERVEVQHGIKRSFLSLGVVPFADFAGLVAKYHEQRWTSGVAQARDLLLHAAALLQWALSPAGCAAGRSFNEEAQISLLWQNALQHLCECGSRVGPTHNQSECDVAWKRVHVIFTTVNTDKGEIGRLFQPASIKALKATVPSLAGVPEGWLQLAKMGRNDMEAAKDVVYDKAHGFLTYHPLDGGGGAPPKRVALRGFQLVNLGRPEVIERLGAFAQ
jgi:hypothetical protein